MAKKHLYMPEAERLFVIEQRPVAEIAGQLGISEKTVRLWKDEGEWDAKRAQYLKGKQSFHEELYEFARVLMKSVKGDIAGGKDPAPSRLFALSKIIPLITKIKDYEAVVSREGVDTGKDVDTLRDIIKAIATEEIT